MIIGISGKIGAGKDLVGSIIQYLVIKETVEKDTGLEDMLYRFKDLSGWKIKKFADKLKDMVCLLIGCTREQLEDQKFKQTPLGEEWWYYKSGNDFYPYGHFIGSDREMADRRFLVKTSPRLILQQLGTECGRQIIHPEIWVNALFADYRINFEAKNLDEWGKDLESKWIITDVRFPNEADIIRKKGGIVIRVDRILPLGHQKFEGTDKEWEELVERNKRISAMHSHPSETGLDDYKDFNYHILNDGTIEDLIWKVKDILQMEGIIKSGFPVQS